MDCCEECWNIEVRMPALILEKTENYESLSTIDTKVSRGRLVRPGLVGTQEGRKSVSDGQQVDIFPVLEVYCGGIRRLT